jgi:hypothetical protein
MRKPVLLLLFSVLYLFSAGQKIVGIYFNLYTDSLKRGFYNYINVDGKLSDSNWVPLSVEEIILTSNAGKFERNDIFIDSSYKGDSIVVKAVLRTNPSIWKEVTIPIRKLGFTEPLKTDDEILNELRQNRKKPKHRVL